MTLQFEETGDPVWKYRVLEEYVHFCKFNLRRKRGHESLGHEFYVLADEKVFLKVGYTWNGSNVVVDTETDMLASAVHDAQCQAMVLGYYKGSFRNWRLAAAEYRYNCITAGMSRVRAWGRYVGLVVGGGNQYKWRRFVRHA